VIGYEAAYVWWCCAFNGVFITLLIHAPGLQRYLSFLRFYYVGGIETILLFGNLFLALLWLWRFNIAGRAIRWNNF